MKLQNVKENEEIVIKRITRHLERYLIEQEKIAIVKHNINDIIVNTYNNTDSHKNDIIVNTYDNTDSQSTNAMYILPESNPTEQIVLNDTIKKEQITPPSIDKLKKIHNNNIKDNSSSTVQIFEEALLSNNNKFLVTPPPFNHPIADQNKAKQEHNNKQSIHHNKNNKNHEKEHSHKKNINDDLDTPDSRVDNLFMTQNNYAKKTQSYNTKLFVSLIIFFLILIIVYVLIKNFS